MSLSHKTCCGIGWTCGACLRKLLLFGLLCLVRVGRARSVLIAQVVVGVVDPNPLVGGQGVETLEKAGIHVDVGCLESECWDINAEFMQRIKG